MRHSRRARGAILCVLACLLAAPLVIQAQPAGKVSRIGYLSSASVSSQQPQLNAFRQKLRELGYVEGRNIVIEQRSAEGRYERLPTLARELARINVDLIVTGGGIPSALAAKGATKTTPSSSSPGTPSPLESCRALRGRAAI